MKIAGWKSSAPCYLVLLVLAYTARSGQSSLWATKYSQLICVAEIDSVNREHLRLQVPLPPLRHFIILFFLTNIYGLLQAVEPIPEFFTKDRHDYNWRSHIFTEEFSKNTKQPIRTITGKQSNKEDSVWRHLMLFS